MPCAVKEDGIWARYTGLAPCGWQSCPNCGPIKASANLERARRIAAKAMDEGYLLMACPTTMRHKAGESLKELRGTFKAAGRFMHTGRPWNRFVEQYGVKRLFVGFESNEGDNGWHFHSHSVYAVRKPDWVRNNRTKRAFAKQIEREMCVLWLRALDRFGRNATVERGVKVTIAEGDVENPEKAARYAMKFGMEAISHVSKGGRKGNKTPWQLLDDAGDSTLTKQQRAHAKKCYREFVEATRGMHWTQFFDDLGDQDADGDVPEEPEEGESAEEPAAAPELFPLTYWEWRCLVYLEKELWLLELLDERGPPGARQELARLCNRDSWSAKFRRGC